MALKSFIKEFGIRLGNNESLLDRDYKHVAERIELHWGYEEFYPFINKLLINDVGRSRNGFPLKVIEELHDLSEIHDRLFPGKRPTVKNSFLRRSDR